MAGEGAGDRRRPGHGLGGRHRRLRVVCLRGRCVACVVLGVVVHPVTAGPVTVTVGPVTRLQTHPAGIALFVTRTAAAMGAARRRIIRAGILRRGIGRAVILRIPGLVAVFRIIPGIAVGGGRRSIFGCSSAAGQKAGEGGRVECGRIAFPDDVLGPALRRRGPGRGGFGRLSGSGAVDIFGPVGHVRLTSVI